MQKLSLLLPLGVVLSLGAGSYAGDVPPPTVAPEAQAPAVTPLQEPQAIQEPQAKEVPSPQASSNTSPLQGPSLPDASAVLPNSPAGAPSGSGSDVTLGRRFESLSGGISLMPPAGMTPLREVGKDDLVEFVDDMKNPQWHLVVTRTSFRQPRLLMSGPDDVGKTQTGVLQQITAGLVHQFPGCQVLREDLTNLGNHDVGMLVCRFTKAKTGERLFAQRAIIQANDQLFYLLALTTPARKDDPKDDNAPDDPQEVRAVRTFRAVLDSTKLLDRQAIRDDQVQRLFHTRTLFTNLTPQKLSSVLIREQWNRLLKDGRDVGWQYIVESPDRKAAEDGIKVGIRTHLTANGKDKPYPTQESESWMFVTSDRHHEDWSKLTAIDDGLPKTQQHPWEKATEFGSSDLRVSRHAVVPPRLPGEALKPEYTYQRGELGDPQQAWVRMQDQYNVNVQFEGTKGNATPITRPLPPFYLPQAMGMLLPRLLPPNEPKQYLVAWYVSDMREVMLRYIDVGHEQEVHLDGRVVRAIPIRDRIGLDGAVTVHYIDSLGHWLASENKETKLMILPSDPRTVQSLWPNAKLQQPGAISIRPEPNASSPAPASNDGVIPEQIGPNVPLVNPVLPRR